MKIPILLLVPFFILPTFADKKVESHNPSLKISVRNKNDKSFLKKTTITLSDISKKTAKHSFEIKNHPVYSTEKDSKDVTYEGFYFNDFAKFINKKLGIKNPEDYVYSIWASDNFSAFITNEDLKEGQAFLAIGETQFADANNKTEDGHWTKIEKHGNPGPYYLVWNNPIKTYWQKWPFKIAEITLISMDVADKFASLKPKDDFVLNKGYSLVLKNCTACHQVNKIGFAKMGPDLKDLAALKEEKDFLKQIRQPKGKMLPFATDVLSDDDVSAVYAYLKQIN